MQRHNYIVELYFPVNDPGNKPTGSISEWKSAPFADSYTEDDLDGISLDVLARTFNNKDEAVNWIADQIKFGSTIIVTDHTANGLKTYVKGAVKT